METAVEARAVAVAVAVVERAALASVRGGRLCVPEVWGGDGASGGGAASGDASGVGVSGIGLRGVRRRGRVGAGSRKRGLRRAGSGLSWARRGVVFGLEGGAGGVNSGGWSSGEERRLVELPQLVPVR